MQLSAEHYYRAGIERMRQARLLYKDQESHALAMYVAGLAVECLLRAFRWKKNPTFEGRHDLAKLFKESGLMQLNEKRLRDEGASAEQVIRRVTEMRAQMNIVAALWANDYRFASEARIRAFLIEIGRHRLAKGNVLKANALTLLNAAQGILDRGVMLWTSGQK